MTSELSMSAATTLEHWDREGLVPSSASAALYGQRGELIQSPTVTISTVSTTVSGTASTASEIDLASAVGFAAGDRISIALDGITQTARIVRIDSNRIYLLAALPHAPATGAAIKRLSLTCSVSALGESYLGRGLFLVWTYSNTGWSRTVRDAVEVVRCPWQPPCTAEAVRASLATEHQISSVSWGLCQEVADEANEQIAAQLYAADRRPALFIGGDAFDRPARAAIRWALAVRGYGGGRDVLVLGARRSDMFHAIKDAVQSLRPYDSTDSGVANARPSIWSFEGVR